MSKCAPDIFVDINAGVQVISQHPSLEKLCYPVSTVVALYTLTGSDYLSSFFHKTKAKFLTALIENVDHICTHDEQLFSVTGKSTVVLNQAAWHRLAAAVYLPKSYTYSNSFDSINSAYKELTTPPPLSQDSEYDCSENQNYQMSVFV